MYPCMSASLYFHMHVNLLERDYVDLHDLCVKTTPYDQNKHNLLYMLGTKGGAGVRTRPSLIHPYLMAKCFG